MIGSTLALFVQRCSIMNTGGRRILGITLIYKNSGLLYHNEPRSDNNKVSPVYLAIAINPKSS